MANDMYTKGMPKKFLWDSALAHAYTSSTQREQTKVGEYK